MTDTVDIAVLQRESATHDSMLKTLGEAVQKMGQVHSDTARILAVHEERINNLDDAKEDAKADVKDLYDYIGKETSNLAEQINSSEHRTSKAIEASEARITTSLKAIQDSQSSMSGRIRKLEQWKWIIMGGAVVIWYIAEQYLPKILTFLSK
jgi:hypothetical protein